MNGQKTEIQSNEPEPAALKRGGAAGWMIALYAAGLFVRLLYLNDVDLATPLSRHVFIDARYYHEQALRILSDAGPGARPYQLSPLYPYVLAGVYAAGGGIAHMKLIQCALGPLVGIILFLALRRRAGLAGALSAGALAELYAPSVYFDASILVESFNTLLIVAATAVAWTGFERGKPRWGAMAGALLGLAATMRPTALVNLLLLASGALFVLPARRALAWGGAALLAAGAVILPFTLANVQRTGQPVLLSANAGFNFYVGNDPEGRGLWRFPELDPRHDPLGVRYLSEDLVQDVSFMEASWLWTGRTVQLISEKPGKWLGHIGRKFVFAFHPAEIPQQGLSQKYFFELLSWPLALPRFGLVFPLAALGLFWALPRWRGHLPPLLAVAAQLLSLIIFFVIDRYRLPLAVVLLFFAGIGLQHLARAVSARAWSATVAWIGSAAGIALIQQMVAAAPGFVLHQPPVFELMHTGLAYFEEGDYEQAIDYYGQALALFDDPDIRMNMGNALKKLSRFDEAAKQYQRAMEMSATDPMPAFNLGNLYVMEQPDARLAEKYYLEAIRRRETMPEAHLNLGLLWARSGIRLEEAPGHLRRYLELDDSNPEYRRLAEEALAGLASRPAAGENSP